MLVINYHTEGDNEMNQQASVWEWDGQVVSVDRIASHLRGEGFVVRGFGNEFMFSAPPMYPDVPAGVHFMLWDNGGEFGVEEINSDKLAYFAPLRKWGMAVGPMTMLYRVLCCARREGIDYDLDLDSIG